MASTFPKGWHFNHAQQSADDPGTWEIGWLDDEDGYFSAILTVNTGEYFQPEQAEPLARAILAVLPSGKC